MEGSLVVLTGASGSGKTTLARALQERDSAEYEVLFFDSVGVPTLEERKAFGEGHQPGGAWQRAMTLQWMREIARSLSGERRVLLEGQMRIRFIYEGMAAAGISTGRVILADCDDEIRTARLTSDRGQAELANESMMGWARFLREEATEYGCEVLDTGVRTKNECLDLLEFSLRGGQL